MAREHVPTPSLNTRLFFLMSGISLRASGGMATELKVWEKAWPIRAAHFDGERNDLKSPKSFITDPAYFRDPPTVKGAMNQHV